MTEIKCKKQSNHEWVDPDYEYAYCKKCFLNKEDEYDVVFAELEALKQWQREAVPLLEAMILLQGLRGSPLSEVAKVRELIKQALFNDN